MTSKLIFRFCHVLPPKDRPSTLALFPSPLSALSSRLAWLSPFL
ncbi:hypothetical protein COLO4_21948 [Corchorus olitorius]|uniref:Uncharacterized protein n=1 Tax=Corchorus olitorius TaxID=93759 RepID=A0A1R3IPT5_9ROSI|nr:hypothetical protein COLO4_21948 [Corchorus olitorius]